MIFSINGAGNPGCPYAEREEGQGESEGKKKEGVEEGSLGTYIPCAKIS